MATDYRAIQSDESRDRVSKLVSKLGHWLDHHIMLALLAGIIGVWLVSGVLVYLVEDSSPGSNIHSVADGLWWGAVTLLTIGYGDLYPVTAFGRVIAVGLMMTGVLGIGVVTARIASYFLERALREGKGMVDPSTLSDHFIVCGWKDDLHDLLVHVVDSNPGLTSENLIVVNNMAESEFQSLKAIKKLKNIKHIPGDFFSEVVLRRAVPAKAKKVLLLADRSADSAGRSPTVTEADARTIMAAMTLSNIAKGTPVVAEILDSKMDNYLKLAHVTDIIYSRDYSRLLLGKASQGIGISNIFHELMTPSGSAHLVVRPIPEAYFGRTYGDYKQDMEKSKSRFLLLGLLENSGSGHKVKELAIKKAQRTADVHQLVENLRTVKAMKFNAPNFNPPDEAEIGEGAMAIVIERSFGKKGGGGVVSA